MFTHYRLLLKNINVHAACLGFFSVASPKAGININPISLFRLYDPNFVSPHFLPIEIKSSNKIFSWPQALMKSIRPEIESIKSDVQSLSYQLENKESMRVPVDPLKKLGHFLDLANLYLELLSLDKCEAMLKSAIEILVSQDSLESAKLASYTYLQLAMTKQLKEEYSIALTYYQEALKYSAKIYRGLHHPSQAQLYAILGMAYATVDLPDEVESCYQKIISSMKTCFSDSPKMWINFESSLAIIYQRHGKYDDAISLHEYCYQEYSKTKNDRINAHIEKINWAATLITNNDFTQAKKLLKETESSLIKLPSINPVLMKIIASNLDRCIEPCNMLSNTVYFK